MWDYSQRLGASFLVLFVLPQLLQLALRWSRNLVINGWCSKFYPQQQHTWQSAAVSWGGDEILTDGINRPFRFCPSLLRVWRERGREGRQIMEWGEARMHRQRGGESCVWPPASTITGPGYHMPEPLGICSSPHTKGSCKWKTGRRKGSWLTAAYVRGCR